MNLKVAGSIKPFSGIRYVFVAILFRLQDFHMYSRLYSLDRFVAKFWSVWAMLSVSLYLWKYRYHSIERFIHGAMKSYLSYCTLAWWLSRFSSRQLLERQWHNLHPVLSFDLGVVMFQIRATRPHVMLILKQEIPDKAILWAIWEALGWSGNHSQVHLADLYVIGHGLAFLSGLDFFKRAKLAIIQSAKIKRGITYLVRSSSST